MKRIPRVEIFLEGFTVGGAPKGSGARMLSRKYVVIAVIILGLIGSGIIVYSLQDKPHHEPLYIDFTDIDSEWLSNTSLRIIVAVMNKNDVDCEIDVRFKIDQIGEITQVLTKTFVIEANHKQELHVDIQGMDSTKSTGTRAEIISQRGYP